MQHREKPLIDSKDYRVIGEEPPREPIISSWPGLWSFIGFTALAIAIRYWVIVSGA